MTLTALEINELAQFRTQQFASDRKKWDILSAIWYGRHADLYPDEFPSKGVQQQAGLVRRSWKMFARHVGKAPTIYVSPLKETAGAKDDADRLEKIAINYNRVWALQRKAKALGVFSVGFGACGVGLVADPRIGYPQLLIEDPRNCLPGAGWDSTSVPGIGFLGYLLVPAAGPHVAFARLFPTPLEGGFFWHLNHAMVTAGSNGVDVFPSLHTAVSVFILAFAYRHARREFWWLLIPVAGICVSTVYLRYHYLIDVICGLVLAFIGLAAAIHVEPRHRVTEREINATRCVIR